MPLAILILNRESMMAESADDPDRKLTLREKVAVGAATVGIIGSALAGAFYGLPVLMKDSAYKRGHISTIASMSDHMTNAVIGARASFVLGAAEGVDLGPTLRMRLDRSVRSLPEFSSKREYMDAGKAWRDAQDLTDEEVVAIAQRVLTENTNLRNIRDNAVNAAAAVQVLPGDAQNLVEVAMFRGMIEAASDVMEIDERIIGRIDKLLAKAPSQVTGLLDQVRRDAAGSIMMEVRGNDKLFAALQDRINAMPRDLTIFGGSGSHKRRRSDGGLGILPDRLDTDENLSTVPVLETASLELDPQLHGIHEDGPEGP